MKCFVRERERETPIAKRRSQGEHVLLQKKLNYSVELFGPYNMIINKKNNETHLIFVTKRRFLIRVFHDVMKIDDGEGSECPGPLSTSGCLSRGGDTVAWGLPAAEKSSAAGRGAGQGFWGNGKRGTQGRGVHPPSPLSPVVFWRKRRQPPHPPPPIFSWIMLQKDPWAGGRKSGSPAKDMQGAGDVKPCGKNRKIKIEC